MTKLNVNIGQSVNDKTGDTLRSAFDKINQNFTELYTLTGGTAADLRELAQDYAAPMFNHASHTNITVTYDDANNKILLTGVAPAVWPVANTNNEFGPTRIAIGNSAGNIAQGGATVAVGSYAGNDTQGGAAVAIGTYAGTTTQRNDAIAIGYLSGNDTQGTGAISIGRQSGQTSQGAYSIAIGKLAGQTSQPANTIILNSTNSALNGVASQTNSFYVAPIRTDATPSNVLFYNTTTKEVTYGSIPSAYTLPTASASILGGIKIGSGLSIDVNGVVTASAGAGSTLVNGARTVSLGSDGVLTLPAQSATLTDINQIVSAKIYRAGASTDTGTIQTALENWMGAEQTWLDLRYQDAQANAPRTRPWAGMPSYTAYQQIMLFNPTGGQLPVPGNMAPTAKTASDAYLTYKELQRNIDIVVGTNTFSFENTGTLRVPGVITKNNNLTLVSVGTTVYQGLSDQGLPVETRNDLTAAVVADGENGRVFVRTDDGTTLRTWQFDKNGSLTFPNATVQTTAWLGSVSSLVNGAKTVSLGSDGNLTFADAGGTFFGSGYLQSGTNGTNIGIKSWDGRQKVFVNETNVTIQTVDNSSQAYNWTFGKDGSLTFPSNTIKSAVDTALAVTTQETVVTTSPTYNNATAFSTGITVNGTFIQGWYQRNSQQIEFALFGTPAFVTYVTGLALGTGMRVVYETSGGQPNLFTGTITQAFIPLGQYDQAHPTWQRVSGRVDGTLPNNTGIRSVSFSTSSTVPHNFTFGTDGSLTFPDGYLKVVPNGANPYIGNNTFTDLGGGSTSSTVSAIQIRQSVADNAGITIDTSGTTSVGGSSLAVGSSINVNGSKIVLGQYTVNSLGGGGPNLFTQNKIEINDNAILIGPYSSNTVDGNTITAFTGWTFTGNTGELTLPLGGIIADGSSGSGVGHGIHLKPQGGSATQELIIYPTAAGDGDHVHLTAGGGATELYLGDDLHYVKLVDGGNVQVQASTANFSAHAAWTFGTDGNLSLPNSAVIGQAADVEITVAATAYTDSLTFWAGVRASYQAQATTLGLTSSNWPFIAWQATGPTAAGLIAQLSTAWQIQQGAPTSPPTPLIFQPAITSSTYSELRAALVLVRDSYATWQALLTSVEITAGSESITLLSNGKLQVPNIIQTDPEEDLVIRVRYASSSSPPNPSPTYTNRNFTFGTNGTLTFPDNTVQTTAYTGNTGTVTSTSVASANGFAGTVATSTTTPAITITTSVTGVLKGNGTAISAATSGTDYAPGTSALATGIVKSTTTTGALTIAVAGTDYIAPYTSQTANTVLAAPNGSAGTPTFRALVAADIPSLTSAQLATILSDETGTGVAVFGTSPAITTSLTTTSSSFDLINTSATTVNFAGAATTALNIGASGAPITGFAATATTSSTAASLGYLGLPQSATATTATLAIGDAGKHIYVTTTGQTITIPANASVAYPIGTTITFIAGPSATTVSIAITTDTLRLAGGTSTGTRTLAANGMATAVKVAATTWYINGTGLT